MRRIREYSTPMKMKPVGDMFAQYRSRFKAPQATVEVACVEVLAEVFDFPIKEEQVIYTVSTRTLSFQLPSLLKSELKFHHNTILQKLENRLGKDGSPRLIR